MLYVSQGPRSQPDRVWALPLTLPLSDWGSTLPRGVQGKETGDEDQAEGWSPQGLSVDQGQP